MSFVNQEKVSWIFFGLVLAVTATLLLHGALSDSLIMDELAHTPAGYTYIRFLDFRLNPEHPPLLKALSAVPLLFFDNITFPKDDPGWTEGVNDQWNLGSKFLYESGNDAQAITIASRVFPIFLSLLTLVLLYLWSRELLGPLWGLLPMAFFAFSPTFLAHGHYVTTDMAATFGVLAALYTFTRSLQKKTASSFILAGIAFGIAQLLKFSAVLLVPFFFFLAIVFGVAKAARGNKRWIYETGTAVLKTLGIMAIGLIVIYATYLLFTFNYPIEKNVSDAQYILEGAPTLISAPVFWLIQNPILRPLGHYALGIAMVVARSSEGNTGYFLGTVTNAGWWFYFPVVFLLKETIPALLIIIAGVALGIRQLTRTITARGGGLVRKFADYIGVSPGEFAMLSFAILYWAYSINSPLNIGVRHLLPTIPLILILSISAIKSSIQRQEEKTEKNRRTYLKPAMGIIALLLIWHVTEAAITSPRFLSYFNESGGSTQEGHRLVTDSNYDWGQDLWRLEKTVQENGISKIAVDYFGGDNPKYVLGEKAIQWHSAMGNPKEMGITWLAVSINTLHNAFGETTHGFLRNPEDEYQWLGKLRNTPLESWIIPQPDLKAGTSLFIYSL